MKIVIGDREFPSKAAARTEIRRILHSTPRDTPLKGADGVLIAALLARHPRAEQKIGPGIDHIVVGQGPNDDGFFVVRVDAVVVDFSYITALNGDRDHRGLVLRGMRAAVDDQILSFRRTEFAQGDEIVCPLSGAVLTNDPTTHVDHIEPFADLADTFAAGIGGYQNIGVFHSQEMSPVGPQLAEPWRTYFARYHRDTAKLRLVLDKANLRRRPQAHCPGCEDMHAIWPCYPGCAS